VNQSHASHADAPTRSQSIKYPSPHPLLSVNNSPQYHDNRQKYTRSQSLQKHVGRGLENRITDEKYRQTHIILRTRHVQVFLQAIDFGIADIRPIEEGYEVEEGEPWD
jgi:hypothetical protein